MLVDFSWDVHWGYDLDFDPWPLVKVRVLFKFTATCGPQKAPDIVCHLLKPWKRMSSSDRFPLKPTGENKI